MTATPGDHLSGTMCSLCPLPYCQLSGEMLLLKLQHAPRVLISDALPDSTLRVFQMTLLSLCCVWGAPTKVEKTLETLPASSHMCWSQVSTQECRRLPGTAEHTREGVWPGLTSTRQGGCE